MGKVISVWDQIEPDSAKASILKARSFLLMSLEAEVDSWGIAPRAAAKRLKISTDRLKELVRGDFNEFSLDELYLLCERAGLDPSVALR